MAKGGQRARRSGRGPGVVERGDGLLGGQPRRKAKRLGEQRDASGARARERPHERTGRSVACARAPPARAGRSALSAAVQKPAGENAVAELTARRRASSSAIAAAHRVAGDVRALEAELLEEPLERVRVGVDGELDARGAAAASARSRASRRRTCRTHQRAARSPAPRLPVVADAVQQHQRRAAALAVVVDRTVMRAGGLESGRRRARRS